MTDEGSVTESESLLDFDIQRVHIRGTFIDSYIAICFGAVWVVALEMVQSLHLDNSLKSVLSVYYFNKK